MKRIIIISEGQTEQSFCNDVLQPHLNERGIYIENPAIKKTGGGIVRWDALKYQIEAHLLQDKTVFVTTLVDFYGLYANMDFPGWEHSLKLNDKSHRLAFLEKSMQEDIRPDLQRRFMPYIQLHEFEGLLFSDIDVFNRNFEQGEFLNYSYLEETIDEHPNPEMINDSRETAPSKRLMKIIKGYKKVVYGSILAEEIGLNRIRAKCPRFNEWVARLESI